MLFSAQCCGTSNVWKIFFSLNSKIERKLGSERRLWQIKFLVIHAHVLLFSNICSLTYFHIQIFVLVHEAKDASIPCKRKLFWYFCRLVNLPLVEIQTFFFVKNEPTPFPGTFYIISSWILWKKVSRGKKLEKN